MESSRRVQVGLALHALSGALLLAQGNAWLAAFAVLLAMSTAVLAHTMVKRIVVIVVGAALATLIMMAASRRDLNDLGHVLGLLALLAPALIDAAGTPFREGRTRWLWLRAFLLALSCVIAIGVWPAPHPVALVPVVVVSHVLLRLGASPFSVRAPLSLRFVAVFAVAALACLVLAHIADLRFQASSIDMYWRELGGARPPRTSSSLLVRAPYASAALALALLAACMRVAPRAGFDGAIAAGLTLTVALQIDLRTWWNTDLLLAVVAGFVATAAARRHIALRVFAGATVVLCVALCEEHEPAGVKAIAIACVVLVGIASLASRASRASRASLATARPSSSFPRAARAVPVDPAYARLGALLHMAALALTVMMPSASLAALVPSVVFASKPLARFGTLAAVTFAWVVAPLIQDTMFISDEAAVAVQAWAPWLVLTFIEATRSRGHPVLIARVGATVGALLFACIALNARAPVIVALLPGAVVVQALLERAAGTLRPLPRVEPLAMVVAVPLLAGLAVFEFVMRWLVSRDGFYPYWDLHPITLFLIDGAPALACLWLAAQAGLRRALPFIGPGGAMLAAVGVVHFAQTQGHEHALAAIAVAMFCAGAVMRPPLARFAGVWCSVVAAMVVTLRGQLPRPDVIAETGYPLWVILWFGALVAALVLSDAMRPAPLVAAPPERPKSG